MRWYCGEFLSFPFPSMMILGRKTQGYAEVRNFVGRPIYWEWRVRNTARNGSDRLYLFEAQGKGGCVGIVFVRYRRLFRKFQASKVVGREEETLIVFRRVLRC